MISEFQVNIAQGQKRIITSQENNDTNYISTAHWRGVVSYHPEELVMTVRSGTPLKEVQAILDEQGQTLLFESNKHSIGGAYAYGGKALRDSVLGVQLIDGRGQLLNFGGQVMKNVAGYDVARLLVGTKGKAALITQISFKVLPKRCVLKEQSHHQINSSNKQALTLQINEKLLRIFDPKYIFNKPNLLNNKKK